MLFFSVLGAEHRKIPREWGSGSAEQEHQPVPIPTSENTPATRLTILFLAASAGHITRIPPGRARGLSDPHPPRSHLGAVPALLREDESGHRWALRRIGRGQRPEERWACWSPDSGHQGRAAEIRWLSAWSRRRWEQRLVEIVLLAGLFVINLFIRLVNPRWILMLFYNFKV